MDVTTEGFYLPIIRTGYEGEGGDTGGDGGEGGSGGEQTFTAAQVQEQIDAAVQGLKSTNTALKAEKTEIKKKLDGLAGQFEALGGEDGITQLREFQKKLSEDESTKLLAEGKHEEWFDKRTAALRKSHEKEVGTVQAQLEEANAGREKAVATLHQTILKAETLSAAKDSGTVAEAAADIQLRAERAFTWDEESDRLVIKDDDGDIVMSTDGKTPKSVAEWLEEQKETARHWWPASRGAGASGSGTGAGEGGEEDISTADFETFAQKRKAQKAKRAQGRGFSV